MPRKKKKKQRLGGCSSCYCLVTELCPALGTPWRVALQAPLSMAFFRQEYWSGWPFPSPGDLLNPGIEPISSALADRFFTAEPPERWGKTRRVTQIQITAFTRDRSMDSINFLLC